MANDFLTWLQAEHAAIMGCEEQALAAMRGGDIAGYNSKMREKALRLAAVYEDSAPLLQNLPEEKAKAAREALQRFSASAQMALELGSVWFMSALLYRDEHKPGEPDNMELLLQELSS